MLLSFFFFFFFLPAVQTVHMFQVNKPGVGTSAAVFRAEKSLDMLCFSWWLSKSFEEKICPSDQTVEKTNEGVLKKTTL